jgi:hypothetical protein
MATFEGSPHYMIKKIRDLGSDDIAMVDLRLNDLHALNKTVNEIFIKDDRTQQE